VLPPSEIGLRFYCEVSAVGLSGKPALGQSVTTVLSGKPGPPRAAAAGPAADPLHAGPRPTRTERPFTDVQLANRPSLLVLLTCLAVACGAAQSQAATQIGTGTYAEAAVDREGTAHVGDTIGAPPRRFGGTAAGHRRHWAAQVIPSRSSWGGQSGRSEAS